jgi:hypothetical protein
MPYVSAALTIAPQNSGRNRPGSWPRDLSVGTGRPVTFLVAPLLDGLNAKRGLLWISSNVALIRDVKRLRPKAGQCIDQQSRIPWVRRRWSYGETGQQDRSRSHARRGDLGAAGMKLALDLLKQMWFDDRGNR